MNTARGDQSWGRRTGTDGAPTDGAFRPQGGDRFAARPGSFGPAELEPGGRFGGTGPPDVTTGNRPGVDSPFAAGPASNNYEIPRGPSAPRWPSPSDTGPTSTGPGGTGPIGLQPFNAEPFNAEPFNSGPFNTGPIGTGPIEVEPFNTGPIGMGPDLETSGLGARAVPDTAWATPTTGPEPVFDRTASASDAYGTDRSHGALPVNSDLADDLGPGRSHDPLDDPSNVWMNESEEQEREQEAERETDDADTTPIFDSVSAWFQRRSPAPPLPTRRAAPQSPLRRPGPTIHRGPAIQRGDSRPPESSGRPGGRGATIAGGDSTRPAPASSFPPPGHIPAPASGQDIPAPDLPARAGAGRAGPPAYSPGPMSSPVAAGAGVSTGNATTASAGADAMSWSSAGDAGWQAAEATRQPTPGGTTRAGLPLRVPMTNLVPGSAEPGPRRRPPEAPIRSPEAVGGRLASFYQGVRQGRDVINDAAPTHRRDTQEDM